MSANNYILIEELEKDSLYYQRGYEKEDEKWTQA